MRYHLPFNQRVLGWLAAIGIAVLVFSAGAVAAQDLFDPEDVVGTSAPDEPLEFTMVDSITAVTSAGGPLTVFQTVATYNGAGPAAYGRSAMHAACRQEDADSHFCSLQEIENAWKTGGLNIVLTGQAWIDNAVVGTIDSGYNGDFTAVSDWYGGNADGDYPYNCNAWTVSTNTNRGLILNSGAISPATESCDDIHPIACCK